VSGAEVAMATVATLSQNVFGTPRDERGTSLSYSMSETTVGPISPSLTTHLPPLPGFPGVSESIIRLGDLIVVSIRNRRGYVRVRACA
jgi:hypothetical protein